MVVQPRLVGNLIPGRSNWKAIGQTDIFVLQHHPRQATRAYRIITRGFPHYRVAEGDAVEVLQEELTTLSHRARGAIQGKITSKKISTWLKGGTVIMSPNTTPGEDDDDILDGDDEDEEDEDEEDDDPQLHLLLHDEEGYLSDLSTTSNENEGAITMTADDSALRDNTNRESTASRRIMRRAISLEDLNTVSAIHHNHHHILDQDSLPERPSSSVSMSLPVPSDTLPSLQPNDQTLYHRYYHHRSLERPSNRNTLLSDNNQYSLYRLDHDHQGPARTMSPDADMDDLALLDDVKSTRSTYTTNPVLQDAGKDMTVSAAGGSLGWLNASPLLEALVNWVEGPPNRPQPKKNPNEKPNPILEIPFQFIALLTYPEPDPKTGDKMSLAMVRETAFVRQRRKTLMMLTAYTLIVRYCSFDFFLVVLFASNCGMLFLMKNSGRMNVNMAKRAVGQRVGWAKQWAGGFFKRGGNGGATHNNNNNNTNSHIGTDNMSIHQGITTSNASSSKSLPNISSMPAESIRGVGTTLSIIAGEKADSAQENSPQIKRRGLFGKRKTYTTSLAPSQGIGASTSSILSPTSATGEGLNGDDVSVMTGRTKRGFFKRNTTSSTNRSATAPPLDQPTTPTMPKHSTHSSTSTTATATILTSKNETSLLSTSPQPQNQSFTQLDWMFPARSPSPSALRKEFSLPGSKTWASSGTGSSLAVAVATATSTAAAATATASSGTPPLPLQMGQAGGGVGGGAPPINSSAPSSGSSSPNSPSPKSASATNPATMMAAANTMTTTTTMSTGRSLASAINPRSLLSSFTSTSAQKQQQQLNSATSPVTPTFPPLIVTANTPTSSATAMPISPRPIKAVGPRTSFLTGSLSTSKLPSVLGGGGGGGTNRTSDAGISNEGGGVYEEEERLEVTMEYQLHQHHLQSQFNPHRRASTTSTMSSVKYATLPSPTEALLYREHHHQHPFAVSEQDHFQRQLSPHSQMAFHPMWQISSAGPPGGVTGMGVRSGSASGDGLLMAREFSGRGSIGSGRGSIGSGAGVVMKEDLLDAVTSAAADIMEGFDREA
ncbi:hypothetical protein BG015_008504 [Linnemannia schmuckeri]|uniref:Uncharacterized protein n=1 Tax=Linnemannia schmuckeri TaxID=64567 RepID=A0A9P5S7H9_9FUNG|nr:hypothetical protein BG015_008504 [Linnemannia schmuckeri]